MPMITPAIRSLAAMFSPRFALTLAVMLEQAGYRARDFLRRFWTTQDFSKVLASSVPDTPRVQQVASWLLAGMALQVIVGLGVVVQWLVSGSAASGYFGLALLVSYPVVWPHVVALGLAVGRTAYWLANPKKFGRAVVCTVLERQVKKLRKKHDFKIVAVAGSVGKTSTKLAIADLLSQTLRVQHQTGNYNDRVTVPLIFFGHSEPNIMNIFAWFKIFSANSKIVKGKYPYDIVVIELGTDGPGFMQEFAYLQPELAVVTAVAPEHMEYFKTLHAVAAEELKVFDFAKAVLVNGDDVPGKYLAGRKFLEYSTLSNRAQYYAKAATQDLKGQRLDIMLPSAQLKAVSVQYIGQHGAKFALAAAAVGDILGLKPVDLTTGLQQLHHFGGRMQVLPGIKDSQIIDDTYNASPLAVKAALDVLYSAKAKQRIAILGDMNELGDMSSSAHREVGEYCDPKKLTYVVTIGKESKKYLAPTAKKQGCKVKSFLSPYEAGEFVKSILKDGAVVLAKGSQNGVFAEEAIKSLLADPADASKLVRQSKYWLSVKQKQFND